MVKYNFYNLISSLNYKNFFSVVIIFSPVQTVNKSTSKNLFQSDDPGITQQPSTLNDCSKQMNLR